MKKIFLMTAIALTCVACDQPDHVKKTSDIKSEKDIEAKKINDREAIAKILANPAATEADFAITQKIRQLIDTDKSFSADAKNIKVETINGVVTLRGSAASTKEKEELTKKADGVQGTIRVDNQLEVKSL